MKSAFCILTLFLVLTVTAIAQNPSITAAGIVNSASYAPVGLPSSAIAQGSIFVIFGTNMGPSALMQASTFPLPTALGGTSMKVTVNGTTTNPIMIYTSANQVAAIMPSSTPVGTGTLTLTYNGNSSSAVPVTVVSGSFGIYTLNEAGNGPGIITDANYKVIERNNAAKPGDVLIIWGTGLGPVQGNEAGGALPGDMPNLPLKVYVGGSQANVTYRGRSGCCAGLDQIVFTVPSGVTGCSVPVTVQIGDTVGNFVTTALGNSSTCSDPTGVDYSTFFTNGGSFGGVNLTRTTTTTPAIGPLPASTTTTDTGSASFFKYSAQQLTVAQNPFQSYTIGACVVYTFSGQSASILDPVKAVGLDAGNQITVNGPNGTKQLMTSSSLGKGNYSATLGGGSGANAPPLYLSSGSYPITGPGGADVGSFSFNLTVPPTLTWTNMSTVSSTPIVRANGQNITWSGGDPNGTVSITGYSFKLGTNPNGSDAVGAFFTCTAPVSAGQFTIPAPVLLTLPASGSSSIMGISIPTGYLSVGGSSQPVKFTAPGLDYGFGVTSVSSSTSVTYQ
jgi:uncharacterized protein (TIGR03437 family)